MEIEVLEAETARRRQQLEQMTDAAEMLWVVLANVSGGNWTLQSVEWQDMAARWRDNYFAAVKAAADLRAILEEKETTI